MKTLIILWTLLGMLSFANAGVDANGDEIIKSDADTSITKDKSGKYIWRTSNGSSGTSKTLRDAKKAARKARKEAKKQGK